MIIRPAYCVWTLLASTFVSAISINWADTSSVNDNLGLVVKGLMDYYEGKSYGGVVGMFYSPYYWWEAGVAWNSMLSYWYYTGNTTYNSIIMEALLAQTGEDWDYMPTNQTTTEGNDDRVEAITGHSDLAPDHRLSSHHF